MRGGFFARPEEFAPVELAKPDVGQQPGQQRLVHQVWVGIGATGFHPQLLGSTPELRVHVLPLADTEVVEVFVATHTTEC